MTPVFGIDLDLGDMRAVRIGRVRRHEVAFAGARLLGRLRQAREIGKGDPPVGAGDADRAVGDLEIGDRGLELVGGELLQLVARDSCEAAPTETPPIGIEREPPVPLPVATRAVSPCTTRMLSSGKSRCWDANCA